jgi:hypothetical protein
MAPPPRTRPPSRKQGAAATGRRNEVRTPPAGPVAWRVVRLKNQPVEVEPIIAKSWFLARQAAMLRYGVEPEEVELQMIEPTVRSP